VNGASEGVTLCVFAQGGNTYDAGFNLFPLKPPSLTFAALVNRHMRKEWEQNTVCARLREASISRRAVNYICPLGLLLPLWVAILRYTRDDGITPTATTSAKRENANKLGDA
jgi:hypothetical protein